MKEIDVARWNEGTVHSLKQWTDRLYSICIDVEDSPFVAGQFTKIALPVEGELLGRPYSFVNPPHEPIREFYFITVADGPLTNRLITLTSGDPIWVMRKASGFLVLDELQPSRDLWMFSTGTAIGPFLSILRTDMPWQRYDNVVLIHAVRTQAELSYQNIIQSIQESHSEQFQYIPFVSREQTDFAMHGRVPAALESGQLETRTGLTISAEQSQIMICGNPAMVKDTDAVLQAHGLTRNRRKTPGNISIENYW